MKEETNKPYISFILPCRNEELALPFCIEKIQKIISDHALNAEIIVSDSSTDTSPIIADRLGAKVAKHDKDGYGNAYLEGFKIARGEILILGDADDTYDFTETPLLLDEIQNHDLVLGQRKFLEKGSMSFLNRYVGNPILSWVLRFLFKAKVKDCHSGFRIIKKEALEKLNLQTTGMEFASEMIIKALKNNLSIKEVPIHYYPRKGDTKLQRLPDGWRHLRFMLLYSPIHLFLIPGALLFFIGLGSGLLIYFDRLNFLGIQLYYHPLFLSSLAVISGFQLMIFSVFAKTYAITHLGEKSRGMEKLYSYITIERAGIVGIIILFLGTSLYARIFFNWINSGFGEMNEIKNSILALTLIILSIQTMSSAFMLSMLGIKEK